MTRIGRPTIRQKYQKIVRDRYCYGEKAPKWKGLVFYDPYRDERVVAPLGFNLLFSAIFTLWLTIRKGVFVKRIEQQLRNKS